MKRLKFSGDRTGAIHPGQVFGPDNDGLTHIATTVQFEAPWTIVETRPISPTGGRRLRYFGGRGNPEPPDHEPITDDIEAQ